MDIMESVRKLIEYHIESEPSIVEIYLFPSEEEIRLVEVDENTCLTEGDRMEAWYFGPDPEGGVVFPSCVALILPEEVGKLRPPDRWGTWDDARKIYERATVNA